MILNLMLIHTGMHEILSNITPYLLGLILMVLVLSTVTYFGLRHTRIETSNDTKELLAFRIGAGLFVGTFALGNNWDYRLVVLILTIPQLLQ